jgi:hypothetical protein
VNPGVAFVFADTHSLTSIVGAVVVVVLGGGGGVVVVVVRGWLSRSVFGPKKESVLRFFAAHPCPKHNHTTAGNAFFY